MAADKVCLSTYTDEFCGTNSTDADETYSLITVTER